MLRIINDQGSDTPAGLFHQLRQPLYDQAAAAFYRQNRETMPNPLLDSSAFDLIVIAAILLPMETGSVQLYPSIKEFLRYLYAF